MMFQKQLQKVSFKDEILWREYGGQVAVLSSAITLVSFCLLPSGNWCWRIICSIVFVAVLAVLFFVDWNRAARMEKAKLKINGTNVNIYVGDLFQQEGLKVIGVNNYIDLVADDKVVSRKTLHGQFVMRHKGELAEIKSAIIDSNCMILENTSESLDKKSYDYGSCVLYRDYVLTVLTKFDSQNKAYTSIREYMQFWMTFWSHIDVLYNSRTINIPIMGAGQTRFHGIVPKKQELLEIALWTLEKSGFSNRYADRAINFVIYEGDLSEIDFYHIQKRDGK